MKNTLAITYNGGAYGTYLEWAINSLTDLDPIQTPFTEVGNSHLSKQGMQLNGMQGWRDYIAGSQEFDTVRFHPKTLKDESLHENLNEIIGDCSKTILIYPDRDHELLCINNYMSKIWTTANLFNGPLQSTNLNDIYDNFPVSRDTSPDKFPRWVLREYLSYYLISACRSQVEWFLPDHWQNQNCLMVYINEILYDFPTTLAKIFNFWGHEPVKQFDTLTGAHQKMLESQAHLGQDQLCQNIIKSLIEQDQTYIEWNCLPLASECWIQWKLREMHWEIQCDGLNDFPTNTDDLRNILYRCL
jgi:hypothetical protein